MSTSINPKPNAVLEGNPSNLRYMAELTPLRADGKRYAYSEHHSGVYSALTSQYATNHRPSTVRSRQNRLLIDCHILVCVWAFATPDATRGRVRSRRDERGHSRVVGRRVSRSPVLMDLDSDTSLVTNTIQLAPRCTINTRARESTPDVSRRLRGCRRCHRSRVSRAEKGLAIGQQQARGRLDGRVYCHGDNWAVAKPFGVQ